jgi:hypothetical protein
MKNVSIGVLLIALAGCSKPDSTSRPPAMTQRPALLSEQKMCADQAGKSFNESSFSENDKSSLGNTFTSHYDPSVSVCYMEVTTRHVNPGNGLQHYHLVYDAFENRIYGSFMSYSKDGGKIQECDIKPRGQAEISCKSGKEFDDLTLKYFGTTGD